MDIRKMGKMFTSTFHIKMKNNWFEDKMFNINRKTFTAQVAK